jgi:predicted HicB family RNase H-like nuclease
MEKEKKKTQVLTIRINEDIYEYYRKTAFEKRVSINSIVTELMERAKNEQAL